MSPSRSKRTHHSFGYVLFIHLITGFSSSGVLALAETVHRNRPLIFNSVAALDMLLFSFLKQIGSRGHTNSHGHPHFSFTVDQVEIRVRRVMERGH
jgi:hypothetical protein